MRINLILFNCLWRKVEKTRQSFHCFFYYCLPSYFRLHYFLFDLIIILKELPRTFLNPETQSLEYLSLDYFLFPHKIFIIKFNFYRNLCWICILTIDIKKWVLLIWESKIHRWVGGRVLKSPREEIESLKGKDGVVRWEVSNLQDGK